MTAPAGKIPYIAGVGASAGGLEALLPMFAHMQSTGRITFIVAQHMARDGHDELVARLIGRDSALPVLLAEEGTRLQPDTVYVIPSGKDGRVKGDALNLSEPDAEHLSTPSVNALFASIAEASRDKAIGIVLSGTGTDGVAGCRAIRANGGLTLAQDPSEAGFNGMPGAAIAAKTIDRVLPVGEIGATLARWFIDPLTSGPAAPVAMSAVTAAASRELAQLLRQVRQATGIDFSSYKEDTLLRRLEKRKATLGVASPAAYQALIRRQPEELRVLQNLFLVSVSSFFRDRESFQVLRMALAKLVSGKPAGEPIRVWVPGCAAGEEPYSLAILLKELTTGHPVVIAATDLNPAALALASAGAYRQTAFKEMDATLRERYFSLKGQHFEIEPELQACVRFEQRDVLGGTPPDNLDLVSCRNLLIYMKSHLQDRLIKCFHQSLRSRGLLFIGQSESLSYVGNSLFAPIDHYHRLFCRRH